MGEIISKDSGGLISLLHNNKDVQIPQPFSRDIFLFDSYVAGTSHVVGIEDLEPFLHEGDKLQFFREPDNPHDGQAIVIKNDDGVKIGYVPQADNLIFSRLMDAGKILFGVITTKKMRGSWLDLKIKIYLHE